MQFCENSFHHVTTKPLTLHTKLVNKEPGLNRRASKISDESGKERGSEENFPLTNRSKFVNRSKSFNGKSAFVFTVSSVSRLPTPLFDAGSVSTPPRSSTPTSLFKSRALTFCSARS